MTGNGLVKVSVEGQVDDRSQGGDDLTATAFGEHALIQLATL